MTSTNKSIQVSLSISYQSSHWLNRTRSLFMLDVKEEVLNVKVSGLLAQICFPIIL